MRRDPLSRRNHFKCIEVDPPWLYQDRGTRMSPDYVGHQRGYKHYDMMPTDDIVELLEPFQQTAARDALCFLWVTWSHLLDWDLTRNQHCSAARVAHTLGFVPKTAVVWVKGRLAIEKDEDRIPFPTVVFHIGGGHYTRGACEAMLVCTRGQATKLIRDHAVANVIFGPSRGKGIRHSQKPESSKQLIERLCYGPRLEIFARRKRIGWASWGDQL